MKRFLGLLLLLPISIVILAICIANRRSVTISLDPFSPDTPALAFEAPLFTIAFIGIFLGILIGGILTWIGQGRHRKAARENRWEAAKYRNRADRAEERATGLEKELHGAGPGLPPPNKSGLPAV